jgi:hypothetical protein
VEEVLREIENDEGEGRQKLRLVERRRASSSSTTALKRSTRTYRWFQRFFKKLPRRSIQAAGFAVSVVGIGWLAAGQLAGLAVFGTGCYFIAHPFESGPVLQLAMELVRRRWGGPPP